MTLEQLSRNDWIRAARRAPMVPDALSPNHRRPTRTELARAIERITAA